MNDGWAYKRDLHSFKVMDRFVQLLRSTKMYIQGAALRAGKAKFTPFSLPLNSTLFVLCLVRYFVRKSSDWGQRAVELGAVTNLNEILCCPSQCEDTLKITISVLTAVIVSAPFSLPDVIDSGVLAQVIGLHKSGSLQNYFHEEDWMWFTVLNAADESHLRYLAQIGLVSVLCDHMNAYIENLSTFVGRCGPVQDLWPAVVVEIDKCGGKKTLQIIAGDDRHQDTLIARSILERCFPTARRKNRVLLSVVLCVIVLLLLWHVVCSVYSRCR